MLCGTHWLLPWLLALRLSGLPDGAALAQAADAARVPRDVLWAIATVESGRQTTHIPRGAAGEIGRLQVTPGLWNALNPACRHLEQYSDNIRCGAAVLAWCHRRTSDWPTAIRCYNGAALGPRTWRYLARVERVLGAIRLRALDAR